MELKSLGYNIILYRKTNSRTVTNTHKITTAKQLCTFQKTNVKITQKKYWNLGMWEAGRFIQIQYVLFWTACMPQIAPVHYKGNRVPIGIHPVSITSISSFVFCCPSRTHIQYMLLLLAIRLSWNSPYWLWPSPFHGESCKTGGGSTPCRHFQLSSPFWWPT